MQTKNIRMLRIRNGYRIYNEERVFGKFVTHRTQKGRRENERLSIPNGLV